MSKKKKRFTLKKDFTIKFRTDGVVIMFLIVVIFLLLVSNTILASFLWKAKRLLFDKTTENQRIYQQYERDIKYK